MQLNDHIISGNFAGLKKRSRSTKTNTFFLTNTFYLLQLNSIFQDSEFVLANLAVQIKNRYVNVICCGSVPIWKVYPWFLFETAAF